MSKDMPKGVLMAPMTNPKSEEVTLREEIEKILMRLNVYHMEEPDYMLSHDQASEMLEALFQQKLKEIGEYVVGDDKGWADFVEPYGSASNTHDQELLSEVKNIELICRYKLRAEQRKRLENLSGGRK